MQTQNVQEERKATPNFWSSKLGAASIASIAAMSAMVILSSQIQTDPMTGTAAGSGLIQIQADSPTLIEIA